MDHLTMNANEISHLRDVWKKCMKNGGEPEQFTQSEFFQKYIPKDEVDFTEIFLKFNLGEIFKSDKIITKLLGKYNCNYLFRQVSEIPHLIIYSDENFVAFQPLGEPGRDVNNFKIGHLMVLNHQTNHLMDLLHHPVISMDLLLSMEILYHKKIEEIDMMIMMMMK